MTIEDKITKDPERCIYSECELTFANPEDEKEAIKKYRMGYEK